MKTAMYSKLEKGVGLIVSRRAHRQLMRVPWDRFHKAYEEYIRWQAFALWARAVVTLEGFPPRLKAILRKRCLDFAKEVDRSSNPELLCLELLPWVHKKVFGFAKEEGWLDALVFYGFRDIRAQAYWTYWEYCESEWKKRRPASFPTSVQWRRSALRWKLHGDVSCVVISKAVQKYLDFEAFVYWLRPLLQTPKLQLPAHVVLELGEECPGLLEFASREILGSCEDKSRRWERLFNWVEDHVLSQAKKQGWLDCVLRQVRVHPSHVRMMTYSVFWSKSRAANPVSLHPSFGEWRRHAEGHIRTSRK